MMCLLLKLYMTKINFNEAEYNTLWSSFDPCKNNGITAYNSIHDKKPEKLVGIKTFEHLHS